MPLTKKMSFITVITQALERAVARSCHSSSYPPRSPHRRRRPPRTSPCRCWRRILRLPRLLHRRTCCRASALRAAPRRLRRVERRSVFKTAGLRVGRSSRRRIMRRLREPRRRGLSGVGYRRGRRRNRRRGRTGTGEIRSSVSSAGLVLIIRLPRGRVAVGGAGRRRALSVVLLPDRHGLLRPRLSEARNAARGEQSHRDEQREQGVPRRRSVVAVSRGARSATTEG